MTKTLNHDTLSSVSEVAEEGSFKDLKIITLKDVLATCVLEFSGGQLRDTRSAFRALSERAGVDLEETIAVAHVVRPLLDNLDPATLGVSTRRLDNIRSLIRGAVDRFGQKRRSPLNPDKDLLPSWRDLIARIEVREHRWALTQLALYCSGIGMDPRRLTSENLIGFVAAMERAGSWKDPRNIAKHTISVWNMCAKRVAGWPEIKLASPFKDEAFMLPLTAFPQSFQDEVTAWKTRNSNPDPLDPNAPPRAMRADTLKSYTYAIRRLASALVRHEGFRVAEITSLTVLVELQNFKNALRPFLSSSGDYSEGYAYKMATQMWAIARYQLKVDEAHLDQLNAIIQRIKPKSSGMGERNRTRLQLFDDEAVIQRLLAFPEEELQRALQKKNLFRRAKGVERALATSLLVHTGVRVKNLRSLRPDTIIRRSGSRVFIELGGDGTKTYSELGLELPEETIALLKLFLSEHRALIPGSDSTYLFPSPDGNERSYSAMREAVGKPLKQHAGIIISPHLYRHVIAKIVVERRPDMIGDVSRRLGHKSINTTYRSYLGTETPAASRRVNALLQDVKTGTNSAKDKKEGHKR